MNIIAPKSSTENNIYSLSEMIYMSDYLKRSNYKVNLGLLDLSELGNMCYKADDTIIIIQFMNHKITKWLKACEYILCGRVMLYGLGAQTYCRELEEDYRFDYVADTNSYAAIKEWLTHSEIKSKVAVINEFDYADYSVMEHSRIPIIPIISSRGCKGSCKFCAIACANRYEQGYIFRSAESIYREIMEYVRYYKRNRFYFVDSCFISNDDESKQRAVDFAKLIIDSGEKVKFSIEARVDCIDSDIFLLLKKAGLSKVLVGAENFNDNVLDRYGKGIGGIEMLNGIQQLESLNIAIDLSLILFDPLTSEDELEENVKCILQHKLYKHLELENVFRKMVLIPQTKLDSAQYVDFCSDLSNDEWLKKTVEYKISNTKIENIWEIIEELQIELEAYNSICFREIKRLSERRHFKEMQKRIFLENMLTTLRNKKEMEKTEIKKTLCQGLMEVNHEEICGLDNPIKNK